jgi:hypothetical protein
MYVIPMQPTAIESLSFRMCMKNNILLLRIAHCLNHLDGLFLCWKNSRRALELPRNLDSVTHEIPLGYQRISAKDHIYMMIPALLPSTNYEFNGITPKQRKV